MTNCVTIVEFNLILANIQILVTLAVESQLSLILDKLSDDDQSGTITSLLHYSPQWLERLEEINCYCDNGPIACGKISPCLLASAKCCRSV